MARSGKKKKPRREDRNKAQPASNAPQECRVWRPGLDPLEQGEELQYDPSAYDSFHAFQLGWPCLSFDILRDDLGALRHEFPYTMFFVAGTQAATATDNAIIVAKISNITGRKRGVKLGHEGDDEDDSSSSDSSSDEDEMSDSFGERNTKAPKLQMQMVAHHGCVNRIRAMPQQPNIVATWSELGVVQIWNVENLLIAISGGKEKAGSPPHVAHQAPLLIFRGHKTEGFALDWSPVNPGLLASGDNNGVIHVWKPQPGLKWSVGSTCLVGHLSSVEDLQWSPVDASELASCSSDGTLRIWDTKSCTCVCVVKIHDTDVNVISWNRFERLIASGGDDGTIKIWHRDNLEDDRPVSFAYHSAPITSIEWSPHQSPMLVATSADNQLSVWDLSVEADPEEEANFKQSVYVPENLSPNLLFVHQGQQDLKEVHWHPQILGALMSTSFSNFNIFKPSNI